MDQTQTGFGLSGKQQRPLGRTLAVIIGCLSLLSGIGFSIAVNSQSIRWLIPSLSLMLCFLIVTAICLALLDIHPVKRVLLFGILPTLVFAILNYLVLTLLDFGQDFGGTKRIGIDMGIGIDMAFLSLSIGSIFWFYRIHRGWRLTMRENLRESKPLTLPSTTPVSKSTELFWLLTWFAIATLALVFNQLLITGDGALIFFALGGLFALCCVLPATYFIMTTRRPLLAGAGIAFVAPVLTLLSFVVYEYFRVMPSIILVTDEARFATLFVLMACGLPVSFLLALRMIGFRLEVAKPWQRKIKPTEPTPHPLDD